MNDNYSEAYEHIVRNLLDSFSKPIALKAIEKQIEISPKLFWDEFGFWTADCTNCKSLEMVGEGNRDEIHFEYNYCPYCGKKLNWDEINKEIY